MKLLTSLVVSLFWLTAFSSSTILDLSKIESLYIWNPFTLKAKEINVNEAKNNRIYLCKFYTGSTLNREWVFTTESSNQELEFRIGYPSSSTVLTNRNLGVESPYQVQTVIVRQEKKIKGTLYTVFAPLKIMYNKVDYLVSRINLGNPEEDYLRESKKLQPGTIYLVELFKETKEDFPKVETAFMRSNQSHQLVEDAFEGSTIFTLNSFGFKKQQVNTTYYRIVRGNSQPFIKKYELSDSKLFPVSDFKTNYVKASLALPKKTTLQTYKPSEPQPTYPSYPSQPSIPTYPSYPSQPSVPTYPSYPSQPSVPTYPSYPSSPSTVPSC